MKIWDSMSIPAASQDLYFKNERFKLSIEL